MIDAVTQPFIEFSFMRRALVGCLALSLGAPPIGVFLMLRRMSLMGDAMSHAILPGAAIGFLVAGLSLPAMSLGGFVAGFAVALAAGLIARTTILREDASLAAFYLVSLALGVLIVSVSPRSGVTMTPRSIDHLLGRSLKLLSAWNSSLPLEIFARGESASAMVPSALRLETS